MNESRDSIADIWGARTPYTEEWPARVDQEISEQPDRWVQSCCVMCTNGCALDVGVKNNRIVGVRGREADRVNRGRLGPKGLKAWIANASVDRLTRPLIRVGKKGQGAFREASWEEAMALMAQRCADIIEQYTSGGVGIYNSGQLFLEDYYTLSVIAHAGLGTNNMDGNTRLCTATAATALRETFGNDGQPGTLADLDHADCILHVGHNIAETQTVSWMRVLDRRRGPNPPQLIVIDPRLTPTAAEADIHLASKAGTNVAVLNGLLRLIIEKGDLDRGFIEVHTVGFDKLQAKVSSYTPSLVEQITGIPAATLVEAASMLGRAERLTSTVLQGVYQSNQATAAAVQVNNLNLIRGMIGRPGCGVIQSNGQPTAQNTRETGCDGEFPGFRNWRNERHIHELAGLWNVAPSKIPHWGPPMHAMEIFRAAEQGSIRWLWVICTNPAVSLPALHRIRKILSQEQLFLIVQDCFMTETTQFADLVLPTAMWAEKTGTFTNADRTVHISFKAVDPPGDARTDMEIMLDFARRMKLADKDGQPLIKWRTPEQAFEAWKACSKGRPCDYSGITYEKLTGGSGVQWPCNDSSPAGTERLYADYRFPTAADECGDFGHDIETGAARTKQEYEAEDPDGRALLKAADYKAAEEVPDTNYPFLLTTGRIVYHFHTRTKTARAPLLNAAAPAPFVQLSDEDAQGLNVANGDLVEVATRRGTVWASARIGGIDAGHIFLPFHYGYWDSHEAYARAANELTLNAWDPVSKQPLYKYAAAQVRKTTALVSATERVGDAVGKAMGKAHELVDTLTQKAHPARPHVGDYIRLLTKTHANFIIACRDIGDRHPEETEVTKGLTQLAAFSREAEELLAPFSARYAPNTDETPPDLSSLSLRPRRVGAFGLMRDVHFLFLMASEVHVATAVVMHASKMLRDEQLLSTCTHLDEQNNRQIAWCNTQLLVRSPQTLVVPS